MLPPPVAIEEAPRMQVPPQVPHVLPRIVEGCVPPAGAELVQILRVAIRAHHPLHREEVCGIESFGSRDIDAAHTDVERMFAHVALDCPDLLRLTVVLNAHRTLPLVFRTNDIAYGIFTYRDSFIFREASISAFGLEPLTAFLVPVILTDGENDLEPHFFIGPNVAHELNDLAHRVDLVFFFRVFFELELDVRFYRVRVVERLLPGILPIHIGYFRVVL